MAQALAVAGEANGTVFQSISTAHQAHEEQLKASALTQQEASAALLTAAHSAAAQVWPSAPAGRVSVGIRNAERNSATAGRRRRGERSVCLKGSAG